MTDVDTGLNVWQMTSNHNRMIEIQADEDVKHLDRAVHFFGDHVAFDKEAWFRDGR